MLVHFEDQDFQFDLEAMDLSQARYIKRQTGLTVKGLMEGLQEFDGDALVALYWLMKQQNGVAVDVHKVNFPVFKFAEALSKALDAESESEADPTPEAPPAPETS